MTRIISVISGKGGVGKTTVVSNIACALSSLGKKVTVIDANISGANLSLHLGMTQYSSTLNNVLSGNSNVSDVVYMHPGGFKVIPASFTNIEGDISKIGNVISTFLGDEDYIILDAAAGVGSEVEAAVNCSDSIILVTTPDLPALSNAALASKLSLIKEKKIIGVVLNQVRREYFEVKQKDIESFLGMPVLATIQDSAKVRESIAIGVPIVNYLPASQPAKEIVSLAKKIDLL